MNKNGPRPVPPALPSSPPRDPAVEALMFGARHAAMAADALFGVYFFSK